MASAPPRDFLLNCKVQDSEATCFRDLSGLHELPEPQGPKILPRPPVQGHDPQAMLRKVPRTKPSLEHRETPKRLIFLGWDTQSPPAVQTQQQQRPVHLPPLPSTVKARLEQKASQRLRFPDRGAQSTLSRPPEQPQRSVHPPPPPSTTKKVLFGVGRSRRTSPVRGRRRLDHSSKVQGHESRKKEDRFMTRDGEVIILNENDFIIMTPEDLEKEQMLRNIPFFAKFQTLKPFTIWRNNVRALRLSRTKRFLKKNVLILSKALGPGLMEIRGMCYQISETGLFHLEENHTYSLQEFQSKQLQEVSTDLKKFQALIEEMTSQTIRNFWSKVEDAEIESSNGLNITQNFHVSRLTCFIRLVKYVVLNTLHNLVVNTETRLLSEVSEWAHRTSHHAMNLSQAETETETEGEVEEQPFRPETPTAQPMFMTQLMLDMDGLTFKPSEEDFLDTFSEIFRLLEDSAASVKTLSADQCLHETQASSEETTEGRFEVSPYLKSCIMNDVHLRRVHQNIKEILQSAFKTAKEYSHTLDQFWVFYKENENLDLDLLQQQDHGLSFFQRTLKTYHSEHQQTSTIQQEKHLGLLLVNQAEFREKIASSPLRCLEVINKMIVKAARSKLDAVRAEVYEAEIKLESKPSTTAEFAHYLTFLNQIQERIEVLEEEQQTLSQMYDLINTYSVHTPDQDFAEFRVLKSSMTSLQNIMCRAALRRDSMMDSFCKSLKKDVKQLNQEVMETKLKSWDPQILDISADRSRVRLLLGEIQILIDELQDRASTYTSYQKLFKLQMMKSDSLDELISEFRLKQLLWERMEEWDTLEERCKQSTLQNLDLEDWRTQVNKYSMCVNQLEKDLPRNSVVEGLRNKVEVTNQKLPVIADLSNPCMKPEHWRTLESVVGTSLKVEELTLASMEEMGFFNHSVEIQQLSAQATGEASAELTITKVEDLWWSTEFSVVPYRDSNDVFVLEGAEEIQVGA
ncbi:LOW QUALITY PROTEIN: dynein heavy chain 6%2C axonemal [Xyrichtys novacula]|uniref:LOW QUALITY PROTEIN: dynein heavy chain 6, axonemal n=1 Tax=Xyrichtys novacula TaxID=13765 RepID=A0AAV1EQY4_XYRNO|nr:LOW QUALITY PROTEIN: dynein heavy chain 6%2C axonemal [Xyrichtys novacula]